MRFSALKTLLLSVFLIQGCTTYVTDPEPAEMPSAEQSGVPRPMRAVERLITEAEQHIADNNWQGAIATAERGLRVDRREPSLYLLLAKSYYALNDNHRAQQFAQQGLRFVTEPTSTIGSELRGILELIEN